ncbi:MAG: hypothetical protein WD851_19425 [Pirellulales bacterium]
MSMYFYAVTHYLSHLRTSASSADKISASKLLLVASTLLCSTALAAPPITAVAFTPDYSAVVVGSQAGLELKSWPALEHLSNFPTELINIHDLAFSPDGKLLATAGGVPAEYGTIELYRWPERTLLRRIDVHDDLVYSIAWRSDSRQFGAASADQRVSLHDVAMQTAVRQLDGHSRGVLATVYLSDDQLLTAGVDATIRLWDTAASMPLRTFTNHTRPVHDLALRPGTGDAPPMVASCSDDRTIRFWQPTIGRLVRFARLDSAPLAIAWTANGKTLWAACHDGQLRAINPDDATVEHDLPALTGPAYCVAVAPDGTLLVAGTDGQLRRTLPDK